MPVIVANIATNSIGPSAIEGLFSYKTRMGSVNIFDNIWNYKYSLMRFHLHSYNFADYYVFYLLLWPNSCN